MYVASAVSHDIGVKYAMAIFLLILGDGVSASTVLSGAEERGYTVPAGIVLIFLNSNQSCSFYRSVFESHS